MNEVLKQLILAKKHSDKGEYRQKTDIVRELLKQRPKEFKIDSRQTHTVGLTHEPTNFRIHLSKGGIPLEFTKMQKVAFNLKQLSGLKAGLKTLLTDARGMWNANAAKPLLGAQAAAKAREGLHVLVPENAQRVKNSLGATSSIVNKLFGLPNFVEDAQTLKGSKGLVTDWFGATPTLDSEAKAVIKGSKGALAHGELKTAPANFDDKFPETQAGAFQGFIPQTNTLQDIIKQYKLKPHSRGYYKALEEALNTHYGHNKWMLKARYGSNALGSKNKQIYTGGIDKLDPKGFDWIAQKQVPMQQAWDPTSPTGRVNKEYRVHVHNGQVVPYATLERGKHPKGNQFRTVKSVLAPNSGEINQVEDYVRQALLKANKQYRQGSYAFDIGLNNTKNPFMVEANASERANEFGGGGVSGFLQKSPIVQDAYSAAIKGQVPNYVLARRGVYGGLGLGGLEGARRIMTPDNPPVQVQDNNGRVV